MRSRQSVPGACASSQHAPSVIRPFSSLTQVRHDPGNLAQTFQVEQTRCDGRCFCPAVAGVVRPAHGNGRVVAVAQPDNQIRIRAPPYPDNRDLLTIERMVRVGDSDGFRCFLAMWGSVRCMSLLGPTNCSKTSYAPF